MNYHLIKKLGVLTGQRSPLAVLETILLTNQIVLNNFLSNQNRTFSVLRIQGKTG